MVPGNSERDLLRCDYRRRIGIIFYSYAPWISRRIGVHLDSIVPACVGVGIPKVWLSVSLASLDYHVDVLSALSGRWRNCPRNRMCRGRERVDRAGHALAHRILSQFENILTWSKPHWLREAHMTVNCPI